MVPLPRRVFSSDYDALLSSTLAAWLRFASPRDIVAFGFVSKATREVSRDAWLLLVDEAAEQPEPSFSVASDSPLVVIGLEFVSAREARALIALGRVALSAHGSMQVSEQYYFMIFKRLAPALGGSGASSTLLQTLSGSRSHASRCSQKSPPVATRYAGATRGKAAVTWGEQKAKAWS